MRNNFIDNNDDIIFALNFTSNTEPRIKYGQEVVFSWW